MSVRNLHWYNANATRGYPLADQATSVSAGGVALPPGVLVDLNLRYPRTLGPYVFVSAVAVTPTLVSVTIQAATDPDDPSTYAPVAAFSARRETVEERRQYALQPQYPGVGGWVVFGSGIDEPYTGRFDARGGLLAPRAARGYRPLPVTSLGLLHDATPLTGIVNVRGEQPVEVSRGEREIAGILRDVVVIGLVQPTADATLLTEQQSVFERFAGPCGKRPESGNCGDRAPVEFINAVPPNCEGKIFIEFRGCARIARVTGECGIVIDCGLGLIDACVTDQLPEPTGKLENEYPDECIESESEDPVVSESVGPQPPYISEESDSAPVPGVYPYVDTFDDGTASGWETVAGTFSFVTNDSPSQPADGVKFLGQDNATQGNWVGTYGADGNVIATHTNSPPAGTTVSVTGNFVFNGWPDDAGDPRLLQFGVGRVADVWYTTGGPGTAFDVSVTVAAGQKKAASLYFCDYDACATFTPRSLTVELRDAATNAVLDTRSVANYQNGVWLRWQISGAVKFRVICTAACNAVMNGIFFDPAVRRSRSTAGGASDRNVTLYRGFESAAVGKKYRTAVRLRSGGSRRNAGLVLNYRPAPDFSGRSVYHVAEIDYDSQQFRISYFNGAKLLPTAAVAQLTNLQLDRWYQLDVETATSGGFVEISATLTSLEGLGAGLMASLSLETSQYTPDTGKVGFHADRAVSEFSYLKIEEA